MSFYASNSLFNMLNIIVICIFSIVLSKVDSKIINVGDNRWDDSTNYVAWAQQNTFNVGDVLVFSYAPTAHNLYEVTKATYKSCDTTTGVMAKFDSGDDQIVLKEAKPYFFICTVDSHCQLGMKLAVNVTGGAAASAISPSVQADSSGSSELRKHVIGKFFVAVAFLFILTIFC